MIDVGFLYLTAIAQVTCLEHCLLRVATLNQYPTTVLEGGEVAAHSHL